MPDDTRKQSIANRLSIARKQAGLTQAQVAAMLKISRPSISEVEAGRRNVTASEISDLAQIYGVRIAWLSCAEDEGDGQNGRVSLAARELAKLKQGDLEKVIGLLQALREEGGAG